MPLRFSRAPLAVAGTVLLAALAPGTARAQSLVQQCAGLAGVTATAQQYCDLVVQTAELTQPRLGIGLAGGSPVPGTASTLGMRMGAVPRFSVDVRATAAFAKLPDVRTINSTSNQVTLPLGSINADAAVGVFNGFSPAPTVGGVLSVDVLGSVGVIPIPAGNGFGSQKPATWAIGARLGLLRESFTLPGLSVSAMYRHLGTVTYGDSTLLNYDAFFSTNLRTTSLRATISKNLLFIGLTAGVGYDQYSSTVEAAVNEPVNATPNGLPQFHLAPTDVSSHRTSVFADLSMNFVLLNLVGEVGWQNGGTLPTVPLPPGSPLNPKAGALFGGLALRLTI